MRRRHWLVTRLGTKLRRWFPTHLSASRFIGRQRDQKAVLRGDYSIEHID